MNPTPPVILTIAGSDCSGGAGIQADIKTITALKGYAASVITAITAQNTLGVRSVQPVSARMVGEQLAAVMDDLHPRFVKIGMVHNANIVRIIARILHEHRPEFVIYDPVMCSTSGHQLMTDNAIQAAVKWLFPLCSLITPNLDEASLLSGIPASLLEEKHDAAATLLQKFKVPFLLKGGHMKGEQAADALYLPHNSAQHSSAAAYSFRIFNTPRIETPNLHGTGCTLSSAIATYMGHGNTLPDAIDLAKKYVFQAIKQAKEMQIGKGNGPLWHYFSL